MRKGTVLAAIVFVALIGVALLRLRTPPERGITRLSFTGLEKDKITELSITGTNPIDVKKTDGKWVVSDGKPADENAIRMALDAVLKIDSSDVVTTNPEHFAKLEVDEAKGTHVTVWVGSKHAAELTLGSTAGAITHVRSGDAVYAVRGLRSNVFSKPSSAWHNLKLFTDALDDVSRVEVGLSGAAPYALVKKDKLWELEDPKVLPPGFRFDHDAARSLVSSVVNLGAKEILDKDPGVATTHLDTTADVLVFVAKDGARREIHLGASTADKDKNVYARISGKDDLYTLTEGAAKGLRKAPTDLRDLTLMKLDLGKVSKLTINSGKTQLTLEKDGATWKVGHSSEKAPDGFELDSQQVSSKVAALGGARALRAATEAEARTAGLAKPTATVTATLDDGKTATLAFGAEGKDGESPIVFARGTIDNAIYVIAKPVFDRLTGGLTTFKKQAAPPPGSFDTSQLANLPPDIRAQLLQQLRQRSAQAAPPGR